MPARSLRDDPADALARVYADSFDRLSRLESQMFDPRNWRKLARVRALQARVIHEVSILDRASRKWVLDRLPGVYRSGAEELSKLLRDSDVSSRFAWTQFHREGLRAAQSDTLDLLLRANSHVTDRTRAAVNAIAKGETARMVLEGDTPAVTGRRIAARMRSELGFTRVPDRAGRMQSVDSYGEMIARTQSGFAYGRGTVVQAVQDRIEWVEIFDGFGCGWTSHTDPDSANGTVRSVEDYASQVLSHPRCQRTAGPRPDLGLAKSRAELADRVDLAADAARVPASSKAGARGVDAARERTLDGRAKQAQARRNTLEAKQRRGGLARAKVVDRRIQQALDAGDDTVAQFHDELTGWSDERLRMHDAIIREIREENASVPRERQAIMGGGLPGAGKSTMLEAAEDIDRSKYVTIDPDDIKRRMIEHGMLPEGVEGLKPMEMAPLIHEESSQIAYKLAADLTSDGTNVLWDITMNRASQVEARLAPLDEAGYSTRMVFVDVPMDVSKSRALDRYVRVWESPQGGRFVDPRAIDAMRDERWGSKNRAAFEHVKGRASSWQLWENGGSAPRLLDRG